MMDTYQPSTLSSPVTLVICKANLNDAYELSQHSHYVVGSTEHEILISIYIESQ